METTKLKDILLSTEMMDANQISTFTEATYEKLGYTAFEVWPTAYDIEAGTRVVTDISKYPDWHSGTLYDRGLKVKYGDSVYSCILSFDSGESMTPPPQDTDHWALDISNVMEFKVRVIASKVDQFCIRTNNTKSEMDVIIDWGDGDITDLRKVQAYSQDGLSSAGITDEQFDQMYESNKTIVSWFYGTTSDTHVPFGTNPEAKDSEKTITIGHRYDIEDNSKRFVVRIYGSKFWNIFRNGSASSKSKLFPGNKQKCNILSRVLELDLPIGKNVINTASMCQNCDKLLKLNVPEYTSVMQNVKNMSFMFQNCYNLQVINDMSYFWSNKSPQHVTGMFQNCISLEQSNCPVPHLITSGNYWAFYDGCCSLTSDINRLLPACGFICKFMDVGNLFSGCSSMTGTVPAGMLWNDKSITYSDTGTAFSGCSDAIRKQVPLSWGGTKA